MNIDEEAGVGHSLNSELFDYFDTKYVNLNINT